MRARSIGPVVLAAVVVAWGGFAATRWPVENESAMTNADPAMRRARRNPGAAALGFRLSGLELGISHNPPQLPHMEPHAAIRIRDEQLRRAPRRVELLRDPRGQHV